MLKIKGNNLHRFKKLKRLYFIKYRLILFLTNITDTLYISIFNIIIIIFKYSLFPCNRIFNFFVKFFKKSFFIIKKYYFFYFIFNKNIYIKSLSFFI